MTRKNYILAFLVCWLAACTSEENTLVSNLGWVKFDIGASVNPDAPMQQPFSLTLTSADSLYSHTWANAEDFPYYESFLTGQYHATALSGNIDAEGYDCACYVGRADFNIMENSYIEVPIECSLVQAMLNVNFDPSLLNVYPTAMLSFHTAGHSYVTYERDSKKPLLISPGATYAYLNLQNDDGKSISISTPLRLQTINGKSYQISLSLSPSNILTTTCGDQVASMQLSPDLFLSTPPTITTSGFVSGEPLQLQEGYPASQPVVMTAIAPDGIEAAVLTSISLNDQFNEIPSECDLLNPSPALQALGLDILQVNDQEMRIDFTSLLENLSVTKNSEATFMLHIIDRLGRASEAAILTVKIHDLEFAITSTTPSFIGKDIASVTLSLNTAEVESHDFTINAIDESNGTSLPLPILESYLDTDNKEITLWFKVAEGTANVPIEISYMGNVKANAIIERAVSPYQLLIDAYAASALVFVQADEPAITEAITRLASLKIDGKDATITQRNPEKGIIYITNLQPATRYKLVSQLAANSFEANAIFSTENASPVPSGDFEEVDILFKYSKLPSGGKYATSIFPIYNMQNYNDISVSWVLKNWASVNAKTFCAEAKNANTWYMQPSSQVDFSSFVSGSKSIHISSVGWSLDGPDIPPYTQEEGEYLPYNANVPVIDHKSAGKLFLGSYSFNPKDCSEVYNEGVNFSSRPSSLNGFFKYQTDATDGSDCGIVELELVNDTDGPSPVVIAHSEMNFYVSADFVAFNLPITYDIINLKPTRLKIMFSSSIHRGTISEEDAAVPVSPMAQSATYLGSQLWIDNLSFSYSY